MPFSGRCLEAKCELSLVSIFSQSHLGGISQVLGDEILAPSVALAVPGGK